MVALPRVTVPWVVIWSDPTPGDVLRIVKLSAEGPEREISLDSKNDGLTEPLFASNFPMVALPESVPPSTIKSLA